MSRRPFEGATLDPSGLWRWDSNANIPPHDVLVGWGLSTEDLQAHAEARSEELVTFLDAYAEARANRTPEQIAEEEYEIRAAFGPGATIVNIITGEETYT